VKLPAGGSESGFRGLLLFMFAFAVAGLLTIEALWRTGWAPRRHTLTGPPTRVPLAVRAVLLLLAVGAFVVALVEVIPS
jgi:hypothetical protein